MTKKQAALDAIENFLVWLTRSSLLELLEEEAFVIDQIWKGVPLVVHDELQLGLMINFTTPRFYKLFLKDKDMIADTYWGFPAIPGPELIEETYNLLTRPHTFWLYEVMSAIDGDVVKLTDCLNIRVKTRARNILARRKMVGAITTLYKSEYEGINAGFIQPDEHIIAIENIFGGSSLAQFFEVNCVDYSKLKEGDEVEFYIIDEEDGPRARGVKFIPT